MAKKQNQSKGGQVKGINTGSAKNTSSMQIQQAPYPTAFAKNPPPAKAQYIPGLMVPGNEALGYRPEYGGGGWAAGLREFDGPAYNSTDDIKNWYKAMAFTGNQFGIGRNDINWAAAQYDAGNLGKAAGIGGTTAASSAAQPSPTAQSYKGIKSIAGGLRIGGDNILGKREANRISRNTGKSYDDVITKALGRGMSIGGGAVRKSNRASGTSLLTPTIKGQQMFTSGGLDDPLSQMRRVNPGRRQMYSGTYELDGKTTPLVESRRGGVNPMSIGGGKGKRGNKGRNKGGGMTDSEITSPTNNAAPQTMDYTPMTPEQMKDASTVEGFGALSGGGAGVGGATKLGRAKSRLRQLGIYGRGTSLLGRGLQYGNTLNA